MSLRRFRHGRQRVRARSQAALLVLLLVVASVGVPAGPAAGSSMPGPDSVEAPVVSKGSASRLDPRLDALAKRVDGAGDFELQEFAEAAELDYERGRVTVVVEVEPGAHGPVRAALAAFDAEETGAYGELIRARVPVGVLTALAGRAGVAKVRPPMRPQVPVEESAADAPTELERRPESLAAPERPAPTQLAVPAAEGDIFAHGFEAWPGPWMVWSPESTPTWARTTYRASEGSYSAYCAGSSITPPGPYANNMESWLWAGPIDLSTHAEAVLTFNLWIDSEFEYDELFVGVSNDDVDYNGFVLSGDSGGWMTVDVDLADVMGDGSGSIDYTGQPEVWIALVFASDGDTVAEGAYVDDVRIVPEAASVTSQGVAETNASALHAEGIDGTGTKVGVIDAGFHGYQNLLGSELPGSVVTWGASSLGPEGTGSTDVHGTAVAEVVHDMAPGAGLYLAQIDDEVDLANAAAWMAANDVDAVNMSLGWLEGPKDGTDLINEIVTDTVDAGVFWANAAGNHRRNHWSGDFSVGAVPGLLEWTSGQVFQTFEGTASEWVAASLMWEDDWSAATQDYDLYLYYRDGASWTIVSASEYGQSGVSGQSPVEVIIAQLPHTGTYGWAVSRYSATRTDVDFDFFDWMSPIQHTVYSRSFLVPADNASAGFMAAGAIGRAPGFAHESYSSEGPTRDGRLTPEIAMPSSVRNSVYGTFSGTSAAAPHLAGAAALIAHSEPGLTPAQIESRIVELAVDLGEPGPDAMYGHGRLLFEGEEEPPPPPPNGVDFVPVAGAGRYETAVEASKLGWPGGAESVVLATGRNWPDALGGATLAGVLDAPILLTARDSIPAATLAEIDRLNAEYVFILGGTAAVSTAVENALVSRLGRDFVVRLDGANRYETSWFIAAVATDPTVSPGWDGTAFIATATNYPDALAAAPIAAAHGYPIFLASPRGLGDTGWFMDYFAVKKVVILGGTSAVSSATEQELKTLFGSTNVSRIPGATRYQTAVNIGTWGVNQKGMSWDRLALATGQNYPDALTGGALQGRHGSVMLLTRSTSLSPEPATLLNQRKADISEVRFLGGLSSLSQGVRDSVADIFE